MKEISMNTSEKFDHMIEEIERKVKQAELSCQQIAEEVARNNGLGLRSMSDVFNYLLSTSLNSYILGRKMMASYSFLIGSDKKNINGAVDISGYSDQPSYSKAFKKMFGLTPGEAFRMKDKSRVEPPISWAALSNHLIIQNNDEAEGDVMKEKTVFGVPESKYNTISEVLELEAFYGLPRVLSNYAYELHKSSGRSLKDCFRFAESVKECNDYDNPKMYWKSPEEAIHEIADKEIVQELVADRMTKENIIQYLRDILPEGKGRQRMMQDYQEMNQRLGGSGASKRAAQAMVKALKNS